MKKIICLIVMIVIAGSAGAANIYWDGGGGDTDWLTPANWNGDVLPTSADEPRLIITATATISSDVLVNYDNRIYILNANAVINHTGGSLGNASASYTLELRRGTYNLNGGTIAINGDINLRFGGNSTFNLNSGSLTPQSGKDIYLGVNGANDTVKKMKISGGTVAVSGDGDITLNGETGTRTGCSQILEIIGNTATISIGDDFLLGSTGADIAPELNFEFAAGGITLIDVGDNFTITKGGAPTAAKLVVDVVDLGSVPQTTYDLIQYGGDQLGEFGSTNVTDLAGAMTPGTWGSLGHHEYAISYGDGSDDIVQLQVNTTPEPGIFGLLGLALLFLRRK